MSRNRADFASRSKPARFSVLSLMRILYDARTIRQERTGVGVYTYNLLRHLFRIDSENTYTCLFLRGQVPNEFQDLSTCDPIEVNVDYQHHPRGDIWENVHLPGLARKLGCTLLHGPAFLVPWRKQSLKIVVTLHDLIAYRMPQNYRFAYRRYLKLAIRRAAHVADRIIVDSQCTKRDLQEILRVREERIAIVYLAPSPEFRILPEAEKEPKRKNYQLPERFVLCVGSLEPRKNHIALIKAFEILKQRHDLPHSLVLVGDTAKGGGEVSRAIAHSPYAAEIQLRPYTAEQDLLYFYNCAALFVFPSLYEGFGLPLLEAMACGVPVVAGKVASVPEVAGDAAMLVEPTDVEKLAQAMADMLMYEDQRVLWRQKGLRHVTNFSWTQTARDTLEVYRTVAQQSA